MRRTLFASTLLLLGLSSGAFAQTLTTNYGYNNGSLAPLKQNLTAKLEQQGYTNIVLEPLKHGFKGTAMKSGKPVAIEFNETRGLEVK